MKAKIFITGNVFDPNLAAALENNFQIDYAGANLTEDELITEIDGASIYIMGGNEKVTEAVINSYEASQLRLIIFLGVQPETFFTPEALALLESKGIRLESTPSANSNAVAEMTAALLLAQYRHIPHLAAKVRELKWPQIQATELEGKIVGILGMGKIGFLAAQKLKALGMTVVYFSRRPVERAEVELEARLLSKEELLKQADVVSLHLPLTPSTKKFISFKELKLMKPTSILMNTARAWLVDPKALHQALTEGWISSAIFDGYYAEGPELAAGDLYDLLSLPLDKFLCTPHQAFNTSEANLKASQIARGLIEEHFKLAAN